MTVLKSTRLGTRVKFVGHSFAYTNPPARGEEGTVTYMPGFKPKTYLPGPGGGLLYVKWDTIGVMGVSPNDLEKVNGRGLGSTWEEEGYVETDSGWVPSSAKAKLEARIAKLYDRVSDGRMSQEAADREAAHMRREVGLGEDDEFPWVRLSYGELPDKKTILDRVGDKKYSMELVKSDADAIEECLMITERRFAGKHDPFEEFNAPHGKHGYRFTAQGLYALLECIVEQYDAGDSGGYNYTEAMMDLASSILQTLNIEWV